MAQTNSYGAAVGEQPEIYIYKDQQQYGPYPESSVREWLRMGQCTANDLGWREGMRDWQPLARFVQSPELSPDFQRTFPPAPSPSMAHTQYQTAQTFPVQTNPQLFAASQKYLQRGYRIVGAFDNSTILERPKTQFNVTLFLILLFLVGIGSLIYLFIFGVWGRHKTYRVQLSLGPGDQIEESGDTITVFNRDTLKARYNRALGFGIAFAVIGFNLSLACLAGVMSAFTHPDPTHSTTDLVIGLAFMVFFLGIVPLAIGGLLFWSARKTKRSLNATPAIYAEAVVEA